MKEHEYGSFDYKIINEKIKKILDTRSQLDNTVQVAMPFVKATTTIQHEFLGKGNIGFTLGLHAINEDVKYENIYTDKDADAPLIGYTYAEDGTTKRVYSFNPLKSEDANVLKIFDRNAVLFSNTNFSRVPPPGITSVTVGRARNGLLASADLQISVPSLMQLESLHRLFLVPGIGMILEWGQQFAQERVSIDYSEKPDISQYMFPWHNRKKTMDLLNKLADKKVGLEEIINDYVIKSEGQYMWMFGRVANFTTKANSDGSATCTVKIVGPSEDSWAYSTKTTAVPAKSNDPSAKFYCAENTRTVYSYFTETTTSNKNFKSLLDSVYTGKKFIDWKDHVQRFDHANKQEEPKPNDTTAKISEKTFADSEDAYFVSWRFFVNVVLNDETDGVKAIFKAAIPDEINNIGLLLPYADGPTRQNKNVAKIKQLDDPMESYVGMNKFLRSFDPSTLIIVNEMAAKLAEQNPQYNIPGAKEEFLNPNHDMVKKFLNSNAGRFDISAKKYNSSETEPDRGFLSSGVWINHKAIVESFVNADTILRGITNLLDRMNRATGGYWELTIDNAEPIPGMDHGHNYMVVDAHRRESSDKAVEKFIDKVHIFNKYIRVDKQTNKLVGSELIDCSIDLSLPKLLFSQIATLGLVQPEDLEAVSPQQSTEERLSALEDPSKKQKTPKLSDPNDTLRRMFAITSLSSKNGEQGPDLTIKPKTLRASTIKASSVCGGSNTQLTAQTAGQGSTTGKTAAEQADTNENQNFEAQKAEAQKWLDQNAVVCKKCADANPPLKFTSKNPKTWETVISDAKEYKEYAASKLEILTQKDSEGEKKWPRESLIAENDKLYSLGIASFPNTGGHMFRSAHGPSQAIDISVHSPTMANLVKAFWEKKGYEVVDEYNKPPYNHIHIEWDIVTQPTANDKPPVKLTAEEEAKCGECNKRTQLISQVESKERETATVLENKLRQFYGFEKIFRYVEVFPDYMIAHIADSANGNFSNAFGASPGALSIKADLTLPGINGLRVGELFWVDRVPSFYKAFGAFQIMSLEDKIDTSGWTTGLHAQFNFLGNNWKLAMEKKLSGGG